MRTGSSPKMSKLKQMRKVIGIGETVLDIISRTNVR